MAAGIVVGAAATAVGTRVVVVVVPPHLRPDPIEKAVLLGRAALSS